MKTRKMRLLSFVLAVAMMFAVAPVSAFAGNDDNVKYVENLSFSGNKPIVEGEGTKDGPWTVWDYSSYGWSWKEFGNSKQLIILPGYTFDAERLGITDISCTVTNQGTIKSGHFLSLGSAYSVGGNGRFIGGHFERLMPNDGAIIDGQDILVGSYISNQGDNIDFRYGTIYGGITYTKGKITGCVSKDEIPTGTNYKLNATGCTINGKINNKAYVVGEDQKVTVSYPDSRKKVTDWKINGKLASTLDGFVSKREGDNVTLTFTMPQSNVTIEVVKPATPLNIENGVPVDEYGPYGGNAANDGWTYNNQTDGTTETNKKFVTEDWFEADLKGNTVQWNVTNNGTLKNGTINNTVTNNGTVEDITATGYFYNKGTVKSGVFSRYADLGEQKDSACWVAVNGGKVNGMQTAGVVGTQEVEVKANTSADNPFEGWTYSGDVSDAVAKQIEEQKNNETMTLTLNGDDGGTMVLTAKYNKDSFGLTMLDGKATVNGTVVTAIVPGQTVTLSIDDSEIPAGMSFDHWVVNPADVELEGGFDAASRTTSFTMPAEELTIYASLRTDSGDDGTDAMTVVAGVAVGAGVAALTYHIGTELYAEQVLGKGAAIPRTRGEVALKAWELAGKPAVELNGEPLSEAAQAKKWAVESGLMQNVDGSFNGSKKMSKLKALRTLDAAKKLG